MSDLNDFAIEKGVLKKYTGSETSVTIPDSVIKIDQFAFYGNRVIKEITIPKSVKYMNMSCLPKNVTVYGFSGSEADRYVQKYDYHGLSFVSIGSAVHKVSTEKPTGKASPLRAMAILEDAILRRDVQMVAQTVKEYMPFELPARALGLACRTGCLEIVKCLVANKFNFSYKTNDKKLNSKYALYYKPSSYTYHADFSLLMIVKDIWDRYLFGYMEKSYPPDNLEIGWTPIIGNEKIVSEIPDSLALGTAKERAEVINFLYSKKKISDVKCKLMLYYAILEDDTEIIDTLDSLGAVVDVPWLDAEKYDASYVPEYKRFLAAIGQKDRDVQKKILTNLNHFMKKAGHKLNVRESIFTVVNCFHDEDLARLVLENADLASINKKNTIKSLIDPGIHTAVITEFLNAGFADAKLLPELIETARERKMTELQLMLMNYLNDLNSGKNNV